MCNTVVSKCQLPAGNSKQNSRDNSRERKKTIAASYEVEKVTILENDQ